MGQIFIVENGQILKNKIYPSGHTGLTTIATAIKSGRLKS